MTNGFQKIKKKFKRNALLKCSIAGASFGILVSSVLVFIQKLLAIKPNPLVYILIGLGVACAVGGVTYFLFAPKDKRLAKRLDEDLGLDEKVQTMLAFEDKEGDIVQLQRENTNQILSETPLKKVKTVTIWKHIILPILAVAMAITAILTPLKIIEQSPNGGEEWALSAWQKARLENLIETVQDSNMETQPKTQTVEELESLLTSLQTVDKVPKMKSLVIATIVGVNNIENEANTYDEIGAALKTSERQDLQRLGTAISTLNGLTLTQELEALHTKIGAADETLKSEAGAVESEIRKTINALNVDKDDGLYLAVVAWTDGHKQIVESGAATTAEELRLKLNEIYQTANLSIIETLSQQDVNVGVFNQVVSELMMIFEISSSELPSGDRPQSGGNAGGGSGSGNDDMEDKPADGGLGSGEVVYGSDDVIYYPDEDRYVSYGEVLNEFYAKVSGQMIDGNVSEALMQYISDYFAKLYNGSEKE